MSVKTMTAVWTGSSMSGSGLLMLLALADFSDDDGNSYPAVATLARKCRMQPRNANYILKALQESGELQVRPNEGPNGTNRYRIVLRALQGSAGVQADAWVQHSARPPATHCAKPLQPSADKPSLNRQETSRGARQRAPKFDACAIDLPDWLPRAAWADWVADRAERRKPISSIAAAKQLKKLAALRTDGHDPVAVLDHSIANGYQGLFAPNTVLSRTARAEARFALDADEVFTGASA